MKTRASSVKKCLRMHYFDEERWNAPLVKQQNVLRAQTSSAGGQLAKAAHFGATHHLNYIYVGCNRHCRSSSGGFNHDKQLLCTCSRQHTLQCVRSHSHTHIHCPHSCPFQLPKGELALCKELHMSASVPASLQAQPPQPCTSQTHGNTSSLSLRHRHSSLALVLG